MNAVERKPNLLLIGAPRCASTSLATTLARHSEIFLPEVKETHFLAMHGRDAALGGIGGSSFEQSAIVRPAAWSNLYRGQEERYLLDASVSTMSYPATAIPNIRAFCAPDTKLLVILRDPVDRAYSSYQYCASRGWTDESFQECLAAEEDRITAGWQHLWHLRALSRYEERLAPFLEAFGPDRVHIVVTEEMSRRPEDVLAGIRRFLDLSSDRFQLSSRQNVSGVPRSAVLARIANAVNRSPGLKRGVKAMLPVALREKVRSMGLRRTEMDAETRCRLMREFAPTGRAIEQRLGRPLPDWS